MIPSPRPRGVGSFLPLDAESVERGLYDGVLRVGTTFLVEVPLLALLLVSLLPLGDGSDLDEAPGVPRGVVDPIRGFCCVFDLANSV